MYCRYCEIFAQSNKRKREVLGNKSVYYRHCPVKRTFVSKGDNACDDFKRNRIFWCTKDSKWLTFHSCLNRQKMKDECSPKCKQKKNINEIMRKEHFIQKRKKAKDGELERRK